MRLDQQPASSCLSGSGLPMPPNGLVAVSWTSRRTRSDFFRSCCTHHARSSSAEVSNSKLLSDVVKRKASKAALGFEETRAHCVAFEKVSGFPLGFDFTPDID